MSNNKQSSVELLAIAIYEKFKMEGNGNELNDLVEQAKAMHKKEIERAHYEGSVIVISKPDDDMLQLAQHYYNETYLETTTSTAKGYWVKHLKTFGCNNEKK